MEIYCLDKNVYFFITFCIRSSGRNYRYLMNETNLTNCALDFLGENTWPSQNYATWAHSDNTFANSTPNSTQSAVECHFEPLIIDHIFWRTKNPKNVNVRTTGFKVLQWKTSCNSMRVEEKELRNFDANATCPTKEMTVFYLNYTECLNKTSFSTLNWILQTLDTNCDSHNMISLSDHDAITATISIEKLGNVDIRIRN